MKRRFWWWGVFWLLTACGAVGSHTAVPETAFDGLTPINWNPQTPQVALAEASGIVFHPQRKTLFAVNDEGVIVEIDLAGQIINRRWVRAADFEGITLNPATGWLYVAVEGEEAIVEIDPETLTANRQFAIERTFAGDRLLKTGGNGIEAIAFVPDKAHPEGGAFFVANQSLDGTESWVLEVEAPLTGDGRSAAIRSYFHLDWPDLSGLYFDGQYLFVISDKINELIKVTRDGEVIATVPLPGKDQEGITMDADGNWYIAQDAGMIMKAR
ncbi:MAG: SdiA-regulated domain-containing protein [Anaerolineae bacterium]